jgi:hypothetical protein
MVKFIVTTALVATVGSAYLGNMNTMAQQVLSSGKKVFGNYARTIESLSKDGENSPVFETKQGTTHQVAFAAPALTNPYNASVTVTPAPQYGQNAYAVTIQNSSPQQATQNPDRALYGSGPIELDHPVENNDNATQNVQPME